MSNFERAVVLSALVVGLDVTGAASASAAPAKPKSYDVCSMPKTALCGCWSRCPRAAASTASARRARRR